MAERTDLSRSSEEDVATSSSSAYFRSPSSSDSSTSRHRKRLWTYPALPPQVCHWKLKHAHSLHVFYNDDFLSSPLEILQKVQNLKELTTVQKKYLELVKFYLQIEEFDFDMTEEVGYRDTFYRDRFEPVLDNILIKIDSADKRVLNELLHDTPKNEKIQILSVVKYEVRNFVFVLKRLLKTVEEEKKLCVMVPEINFIELPRKFAELCQLKAWLGKEDPSLIIGRLGVQKITSEPDLRLYKTGMSILSPENPETVVSVIQIKRDSDQKNKDTMASPPTKKIRVSSDSNDGFETGSTKSKIESLHIPALQKRLGAQVLGQHAGELFLDYTRFAIGPKIADGSKIFTMPGMIVDGTKVYFTVLEMTSKHHQKLLQESKKKTLEEQDRAIIYYSQPLDFLIRNEREVLLDSFMRLNNIFKVSD